MLGWCSGIAGSSSQLAVVGGKVGDVGHGDGLRRLHGVEMPEGPTECEGGRDGMTTTSPRERDILARMAREQWGSGVEKMYGEDSWNLGK